MPGTYSRIKNWIDQETLTHSDLNGEFDNIINNSDPDGIDDASANATAMQATADPYPGASESLATNLRGEFQRLRYLHKQSNGCAQWYIFPDLVTKTANYTASQNDRVILCDATSGAITITLPAASGLTDKIFHIKKTDSSTNAVTVDGNASETIDGAATYILYAQNDEISLVCDGSNWKVLSFIKASPSFSVHKNSTNQTGVVTATWTKLTWSTEEFDTNANFASDKFTPTVAGKYLLAAGMSLTTVADQHSVNLAVYKNGSAYKYANDYTSGTAGQGVNLTVIVDANGTTDYFEAYAYQASGSDRIVSGDAQLTFFQGYRVG